MISFDKVRGFVLDTFLLDTFRGIYYHLLLRNS